MGVCASACSHPTLLTTSRCFSLKFNNRFLLQGFQNKRKPEPLGTNEPSWFAGTDTCEKAAPPVFKICFAGQNVADLREGANLWLEGFNIITLTLAALPQGRTLGVCFRRISLRAYSHLHSLATRLLRKCRALRGGSIWG